MGTTWLHQQRIEAVLDVLGRHGAARLLDLGCGAGDFLLPLLAQPRITRICGIEQDAEALGRLRAGLARLPVGDHAKVELRQGSILEPAGLPGGEWDAIVMIEVIEHLDPGHLSQLERVIFAPRAPPLVVLTTPNADFNPLLGVPPGRMRHPGHRFEWGRARFRAWAEGVARRHDRRLTISHIAGLHPDRGGASQMAVFLRHV